MDHIAELANVSKATVSRALRDSPLVRVETKKLVLEAARKSGYVVNQNARKLRDKRTNTIAVAMDFPSFPEQRVSDPFIFELLSDLVAALSVREKDVLLCSPDVSDALAFQTMLAAKSADGIIFLGQGFRQTVLDELARLHAPFVVWGGVVDESAYCTVGSDNAHGGYLVGRRFTSLRRENILFVGDQRHLEIRLRRTGLMSGLQEGGARATVTDLPVQDLAYQTVLLAAQGFLAQSGKPVDAVFAMSDDAAIAFSVALKEVGLVPGKDVSVVGYNDVPAASYVSPAITSVRQDTLQAGGLLVEKLMQILDGIKPRSVMLPTRLVVRET